SGWGFPGRFAARGQSPRGQLYPLPRTLTRGAPHPGEVTRRPVCPHVRLATHDQTDRGPPSQPDQQRVLEAGGGAPAVFSPAEELNVVADLDRHAHALADLGTQVDPRPVLDGHRLRDGPIGADGPGG